MSFSNLKAHHWHSYFNTAIPPNPSQAVPTNRADHSHTNYHNHSKSLRTSFPAQHELMGILNLHPLNLFFHRGNRGQLLVPCCPLSRTWDGPRNTSKGGTALRSTGKPKLLPNGDSTENDSGCRTLHPHHFHHTDLLSPLSRGCHLSPLLGPQWLHYSESDTEDPKCGAMVGKQKFWVIASEPLGEILN